MRIHSLMLSLALLCLALLISLNRDEANLGFGPLPAFDIANADSNVSDLREQAGAVDDLRWLTARGRQAVSPALAGRSELLAERARLQTAGDASGVAQLNAVLAQEALARAARVVDRWLDRRDQATDLFPRSLELADQGWAYADSGADLFGHLAIGTRLLAPARYEEVLETLAAERKLEPLVPDDVQLPSGERQWLSHDERMFGVAEYAKDGLLPLVERLGPRPWLGRLTELTDALLAGAAVPTPRGNIPADSSEINGDLLQVLARLSWATGEPRYHDAAERIGLVYLDVLPTTRYLPPHRWDFINNEPIERRRFRLSDHGNEILAGLLEWHLGETLRGEPAAAQRREPIRRMLDRLLEKGRSADGLWYRVIEIPSGKVEQEGLTDNWGYLLQSYLMAAIVERRAPDGDPALAARYERAVDDALRALPRYEFYPWQQGEMDGYADTLESALYLLDAAVAPGAAAWLDQQMPVLYGFQAADGRVLDGYLDGNFIRTALLYGYARSQGLHLEPWRESTRVGAALDGSCLVIALASNDGWSGRLVFDTPRHRLHLGLPLDYPRLNQWPEWFVVEAEQQYQLTSDGRPERLRDGASLADGLPLQLAAGEQRQLRVCPADQ